MFKITIYNMKNGGGFRKFEFSEPKTAMSHFREHMDANNINDCHFYDDGFNLWLADENATGEFMVMAAGNILDDVRIELTAEKTFSRIQENDIANMDRIKGKLREIGARHIGRNDDGVGAFIPSLDFWQYENRVFMIRETRSSIDGHRFELYCSMDFNSMDSAFRQIENFCLIQTFRE